MRRAAMLTLVLIPALALAASADGGAPGLRDSTLGVEILSLTPELAEHFGTETGVLVARLDPRRPAARAGVAVGDVLVAAAARPVASLRDLQRALGPLEAGDPVQLDLLRQGRPLSVTAVLDAAGAAWRDRSRYSAPPGYLFVAWDEEEIEHHLEELAERLGELGEQLGESVEIALDDVDWHRIEEGVWRHHGRRTLEVDVGELVSRSLAASAHALQGLHLEVGVDEVELEALERDLERQLQRLERELERAERELERTFGS